VGISAVHYSIPHECHIVSKQNLKYELNILNNKVSEFHLCRVIYRLKSLNNLLLKWIITMVVKEFVPLFIECGFIEIFYEHWWLDCCPPSQVWPLP
jgi:hypothetical protein